MLLTWIEFSWYALFFSRSIVLFSSIKFSSDFIVNCFKNYRNSEMIRNMWTIINNKNRSIKFNVWCFDLFITSWNYNGIIRGQVVDFSFNCFDSLFCRSYMIGMLATKRSLVLSFWYVHLEEALQRYLQKLR